MEILYGEGSFLRWINSVMVNRPIHFPIHNLRPSSSKRRCCQDFSHPKDNKSETQRAHEVPKPNFPEVTIAFLPN